MSPLGCRVSLLHLTGCFCCSVCRTIGSMWALCPLPHLWKTKARPWSRWRSWLETSHGRKQAIASPPCQKNSLSEPALLGWKYVLHAVDFYRTIVKAVFDGLMWYPVCSSAKQFESLFVFYLLEYLILYDTMYIIIIIISVHMIWCFTDMCSSWIHAT